MRGSYQQRKKKPKMVQYYDIIAIGIMFTCVMFTIGYMTQNIVHLFPSFY